MLSKSQIQLIQSLKQIKFRREHGLFVAEGPKIVEELPGSDIQVKAVYALEEWLEENQGKFEYIKAEINRVTSKELERISNLSTPNKVLAVCHIPERDTEEISDEDGSVIALDGIRDPGNLGTIIRTADWFGVRHIICSEDCVDVYNPKVVQATMGSVSRVKVYYTDRDEYLSHLNAYVNEQKRLGRFARPLNNNIFNVMEWLEYHDVVANDSKVLVGLSFLFLMVYLLSTIALTLTKFVGKKAETSLRRALGASRRTIFNQQIVEVGLIGFTGGVIGLSLAALGLVGIEHLYEAPGGLVKMDWVMVITAIGIAIVSSMMAGLYPAWRVCKIPPATQLKTQ